MNGRPPAGDHADRAGALRIPYLAVHQSDGKRVLLYRFFDTAGRLLYVGITDDPHVRWAAHARNSSWWPQVSVVHTEWFDSRTEASAAEVACIRHEDPLHNVKDSTKTGAGRRVRSMYLHPLTRECFGDRPFTYRDLSEQLKIPYGTVCQYARRLVQQGAFRKVSDAIPGRAARFVALADVSPMAASPVQAPLPAQGT